MLIFGITGGSGTGKTTVSDIFRENGVTVIDADKSAREVVKKGSKCLDELCGFFGENILLSDGTLDRKKLGEIVFSDEKKLAKLNEITHKYIKEDVMRQIEESKTPLAAIDGAVIIGSIIEPLCKFIVSVTSDRNTRLKRIVLRDGISEDSAKKRLDSQPSEDFYKKHSKYVINNDKDLSSLVLRTKEVLEEIRKNEV